MFSFQPDSHRASARLIQGAIQQSEGYPVPDPLWFRAELQFGELGYILRVLSLQRTLKTSAAQDDSQKGQFHARTRTKRRIVHGNCMGIFNIRQHSL
jgi:hypothetical protein